MNNRKRTKGRRIQAIKVPSMIYEELSVAQNVIGKYSRLIPNQHPKAGKTIFVKHLPTPAPPPTRPI